MSCKCGNNNGWICTRCGQSNSPWKDKCDCNPPNLSAATNTVLPNWPWVKPYDNNKYRIGVDPYRDPNNVEMNINQQG